MPQLSELLEFPELERGDSGFLADKMHQLPLEMPVFNLCRNNNECFILQGRMANQLRDYCLVKQSISKL